MNDFNGVNPNGEQDANARVFKVVNGRVSPVKVSIRNGSLASQAVGPPLSNFEMSCTNRRFANIGEKLLGDGVIPLGKQKVFTQDSVLGALVHPSGKGLRDSYSTLIQQAFRSQFWGSPQLVTIDNDQFTLMEANFSLFFGLAVQLYEATLISDQAPLDRFLAGKSSALTAQQKLGKQVFEGQARCDQCHGGTLLASAKNGGSRVDRFFNIAVRPNSEDAGDALDPGKGLFKVSILRNIELTGPYFHNGGQATLRQVVDFYNRGGDFPSKFTDSAIRPLGLNDDQKDALVAFLLAATDERVRFEKAPFDHPQLFVPDGHPGDEFGVTDNGNGEAMTTLREIPAVGAGGLGSPIRTFLNLSPFQP